MQCMRAIRIVVTNSTPIPINTPHWCVAKCDILIRGPPIILIEPAPNSAMPINIIIKNVFTLIHDEMKSTDNLKKKITERTMTRRCSFDFSTNYLYKSIRTSIVQHCLHLMTWYRFVSRCLCETSIISSRWRYHL